MREVGVVNWLRRTGRRILPHGSLRQGLSRILLNVEQQRGVPVEVAGMRIIFDPSARPGSTTEQMQLDAAQLEIFAQSIRAGHYVADVGAYRGEYTVVAAAKVGSLGRVFAFEPTIGNRRFIERNLTFNDLNARVTIESTAVSDRDGRVEFFTSEDGITNSQFRVSVPAQSAQQLMVKAVTLDHYFSAVGQLPHVVKIDVEGAEWRVLRGADAIVRSDATIICELHPWAWAESGDDPEQMRAWLAERGRTIVDSQSGEPVSDWRYQSVLMRKAR